MRASWPEAGPVNDILVRSSQYLTDAAHEFRLRLKSVLNAKPKVGRIGGGVRTDHLMFFPSHL